MNEIVLIEGAEVVIPNSVSHICSNYSEVIVDQYNIVSIDSNISNDLVVIDKPVEAIAIEYQYFYQLDGFMGYGKGGIEEAPFTGLLYGRKDNSWHEIIIPNPGISEAPNDAKLYGRKNNLWTEIPAINPGISDAPNDLKPYIRKSQMWQELVLPESIGEAPVNSKLYGRFNKSWQEIILPNPGIVDAPVDFRVYARRNSVWYELPSSISEAPINTKLYGRQNGTWVEIDLTAITIPPDTYLYEQVDLLLQFRNVAIGNSIYNEQRYVTIYDLIAMGIIKRIGSETGYLEPGVGIVKEGPVTMATPPTPIGLYLYGDLTSVRMIWFDPFKLYQNHGAVLIYKNTVNDRNSASLINEIVDSTSFVDTAVQRETTYYYWIRFISSTGVIGPFNSTAGSSVQTFDNPNLLKDILEGEITANELHQDLLEPIELINADGGIVDTQIQLALDILNEATVRVNQISAEANARAAALLAEASDRQTAIDQAVEILQTEDESLARKVEILTSTTNATFDISKLWQFDTALEGWTGTGGTPVISDGKMRPGFSGNTYVTSPSFIIDGSLYTEVRIRIKKYGNPIWVGNVFYIISTSGTYIPGQVQTVLEPTYFNNEATVSWDFSAIPEWNSAIITGIRVQLCLLTDASNYFEMDWIGVGRQGPGASIAAILEERNAWTTSVAAEATLRTQLATQLRGNYSGNNLNDLTTGLVYQERQARATQDSVLAVQIASLSAGTNTQFDSYKMWYFDAGVESWTGGTIVFPGWLRVNAGSNIPRINLITSGVGQIDGKKYTQIRLRFKKVGSPTWNGGFYFSTVELPYPSEYSIGIGAEPTFDSNGIALLTIEPYSLGGAAWLNHTGITALGLNLYTGTNSDNYFEMDWIGVGRPSPGASTAELLEEMQARINGDNALSSSITTLNTTIAGKANQSTVDSLTSTVTSIGETVTAQGSQITAINSTLPNKADVSALSTLTGTVTTQGDDISAQGSQITTLTASVRGSGNLIPTDTEFSNNLAGWTLGSNTTGQTVTVDRNLAGTSWKVVNTNNIGFTHAAISSAGTIAEVYLNTPITVKPGSKYCFSIFGAAHRCRARVRFIYYDAAGAYISDAISTDYTPGTGGDNLANWSELSVMGVAPANARIVYLVVRLQSTGENNPYLWFCHPMFSEIPSATTTVPQYEPGGSQGAYAAIQTEATVRANETGPLMAQWTVKTTVGSLIGGVGFYNDGVTTRFLIHSDQFAVFYPGAQTFGLVVSGGKVLMPGDLVVPGSIKTQSIEVGAVTASSLYTVNNDTSMGAPGSSETINVNMGNFSSTGVKAKFIISGNLYSGAGHGSLDSSFGLYPGTIKVKVTVRLLIDNVIKKSTSYLVPAYQGLSVFSSKWGAITAFSFVHQEVMTSGNRNIRVTFDVVYMTAAGFQIQDADTRSYHETTCLIEENKV